MADAKKKEVKKEVKKEAKQDLVYKITTNTGALLERKGVGVKEYYEAKGWKVEEV